MVRVCFALLCWPTPAAKYVSSQTSMPTLSVTCPCGTAEFLEMSISTRMRLLSAVGWLAKFSRVSRVRSRVNIQVPHTYMDSSMDLRISMWRILVLHLQKTVEQESFLYRVLVATWCILCPFLEEPLAAVEMRCSNQARLYVVLVRLGLNRNYVELSGLFVYGSTLSA